MLERAALRDARARHRSGRCLGASGKSADVKFCRCTRGKPRSKMTSSFSAAAAAGSVLACFSSVIRIAGARGVARYGGAAPMGLVEGCEWNFSWRQVLHPILQVHVRATKMTSSFSAAAAAGSLPTCSSCVIRVAGARGIARCEGAPPIGQMLGCEWQIC